MHLLRHNWIAVFLLTLIVLALFEIGEGLGNWALDKWLGDSRKKNGKAKH